MNRYLFVAPAIVYVLSSFPSGVQAQNHGDIFTVAGNGTGAHAGDGGLATQASLRFPARVALAQGHLFSTDSVNNRVRKIDESGHITTAAGTGSNVFSGDGGPATQAGINPAGIAIDADNNIYVSDGINHRIRKIDTSGNIITVAGDGFGQGNNFGGRFSGDGGPATLASLNAPKGLAIHGNNLYIADHANGRIRCINLTTGTITTVAGNGSFTPVNGVAATQSGLLDPYDVAVDNAGNIYIALLGENAIRRVELTGTINRVAGGTAGSGGYGGPATTAQLDHPQGVAVFNGHVFIGDSFNNRVRMVNTAGTISTIAGSGPTGPGQGSFSGDGGPGCGA